MSRRDLIDEQAAAADEVIAQLGRFPEKSRTGRTNSAQALALAAEWKDTPLGTIARHLRTLAEDENLDVQVPERGRKRPQYLVGAVGGPLGERLLRAAGRLWAPRRGAGINAQLVLALAEVFVAMLASGVAPPRRQINAAHARFPGLWAALFRHGQLHRDDLTAEQRARVGLDLGVNADWSGFEPGKAQRRAVADRAKRYFEQAARLIDEATI
jgi:hypothetical protein